jgi:hypothetical protein
VFLLRKATAEALRAPPTLGPTGPGPQVTASTRTLRISGTVPPEVMESARHEDSSKASLGLRPEDRIRFSVTVSGDSANGLATELRQISQELGLAEAVKVE